MRAAFASWNDRIAPVFDVAREVRLVHAESERIVGETAETLPDDSPVDKARRLVELGVDTLVCGAISRPLLETISGYGIRVFPFIAGDLHEVIRAWLEDGLRGDAFAMPGCPGCGRHRGVAASALAGQRSRGRRDGARGAGSGRGRGTRHAGRRETPDAGAPSGLCACPQCGHREAHELGIPCVERTCPKCGVALIRE